MHIAIAEANFRSHSPLCSLAILPAWARLLLLSTQHPTVWTHLVRALATAPSRMLRESMIPSWNDKMIGPQILDRTKAADYYDQCQMSYNSLRPATYLSLGTSNICLCWLAGAGGDARTLPILDSFCGGLRFIISMAEGRSFGGAAEGRKGPRKRCIFPKSDALLDIGVLTREKKGEKRCESDASIGMHHFHAKIGGSGGFA